MRLLHISHPSPLDPGDHTSRPFPRCSDRWVGLGERGCPLGFRLLRRGPRETSLPRALRVKLKEEKNPRLAHRGVWRKAVGDFSRVEGSRNDSISSSCSSAEPGLPPQVRAPPPHMVCSSSSKHKNFKMVLWARGGPTGKGRIKGTWGGLAGA